MKAPHPVVLSPEVQVANVDQLGIGHGIAVIRHRVDQELLAVKAGPP